MQIYLLENKTHHNPLLVKGVNTENNHMLREIPGVCGGVLHTS